MAIPTKQSTPWAGAGSLPVHLLPGVLQGLALWLLGRPFTDGVFATYPALPTAGIHFAVAAPVGWYLLAGSPLHPRARAGVALAVAALVGGLAGHATATSGKGHPPFSFTLAAVVLACMLVILAAGFDARRRWFDYPRLFEFGWRNALLAAVAGALTGILWTVLFGAAWMLNALGVSTLLDLLREQVVIQVLSWTAFAFFILQATQRSEALVVLRNFWLTLNAWFLPLALLLAIVWVAALAVTGPQPLFQTRRAALLLFWFVALAVLFMNAAYQDGRGAPHGRAIARIAAYAWLAVPVLAGVGLWALSLRVAQHGWTVDRLWAAVVGGMALLYGVGYAGSVVPRARWMPTLQNTNVVASLVLSVVIVACISPIADVRRIAVDSQVSRLRSGQVAAAKFDFGALKQEGGTWGHDALVRLSEDASVTVRGEARAALNGLGRWPDRDQDRDAALAVLRNDVRILPSGTPLDARLAQLLSRPDANWGEKACVRDPARCALWFVDLDGDGTAEAVLLWENNHWVQGGMYALVQGSWRREAELAGPPAPLADWITAIESRAAGPEKPLWPDLQVAGKRYSVRPH